MSRDRVFTLPSHWETYLVWGDDTDLPPADVQAVRAFFGREHITQCRAIIPLTDPYASTDDTTHQYGTVTDFLIVTE